MGCSRSPAPASATTFKSHVLGAAVSPSNQGSPAFSDTAVSCALDPPPGDSPVVGIKGFFSVSVCKCTHTISRVASQSSRITTTGGRAGITSGSEAEAELRSTAPLASCGCGDSYLSRSHNFCSPCSEQHEGQPTGNGRQMPAPHSRLSHTIHTCTTQLESPYMEYNAGFHNPLPID